MNDPNPTVKARISIFERIVPFSALALAASGGAAGAFTIFRLLDTLQHAENAGPAAIAGGLAEATLLPLGLFYASVILGIIGILVAVGRMIVKTSTASPSGVSYLVLGIISLIPAGLIWQAGGLMMTVFEPSEGQNMIETGASVASYITAALIVTPFILLGLLVWSLVPFKARMGRRFGPLACLIFIQILLFATAAAFQWRLIQLWELNQKF